MYVVKFIKIVGLFVFFLGVITTAYPKEGHNKDKNKHKKHQQAEANTEAESSSQAEANTEAESSSQAEVSTEAESSSQPEVSTQAVVESSSQPEVSTQVGTNSKDSGKLKKTSKVDKKDVKIEFNNNVNSDHEHYLSSGHFNFTNSHLRHSSVGHLAKGNQGKLIGRVEFGFLGSGSLLVYDKEFEKLFQLPGYGLGVNLLTRFRFHSPAYVPKFLVLLTYDQFNSSVNSSAFTQTTAYLGIEWSLRLISHLDVHFSLFIPGIAYQSLSIQSETSRITAVANRYSYGFSSAAEISFEVHVLPSFSLHLGSRLLVNTVAAHTNISVTPVFGFVIKLF